MPDSGRSALACGAGVPGYFVVRADAYARLYVETIDRSCRSPGVRDCDDRAPRWVQGRFRVVVLDSGVAYPALRRVVVDHRGVYAGCVLDALAEASQRNRGGGTVRRDRCRDEAGDEA